MSAQIDGLLDVTGLNRDMFEIVRDQIGAILATESSNQMALAGSTPGANPSDYELNVYLERDTPWDMYRETDEEVSVYQAPILNICFDQDKTSARASSLLRQARDAIFYIDIYGYGIASDNTEGGHFIGDEASRREVARAASLVRKILFSGPWMSLGMDGVVGNVVMAERKMFALDRDQRAFHVAAMRMVITVNFVEGQRENSFPNIETMVLQVNRAEDGKLLFEATLDVT